MDAVPEYEVLNRECTQNFQEKLLVKISREFCGTQTIERTYSGMRLREFRDPRALRVSGRSRTTGDVSTRPAP